MFIHRHGGERYQKDIETLKETDKATAKAKKRQSNMLSMK